MIGCRATQYVILTSVSVTEVSTKFVMDEEELEVLRLRHDLELPGTLVLSLWREK